MESIFPVVQGAPLGVFRGIIETFSFSLAMGVVKTGSPSLPAAELFWNTSIRDAKFPSVTLRPLGLLDVDGLKKASGCSKPLCPDLEKSSLLSAVLVIVNGQDRFKVLLAMTSQRSAIDQRPSPARA
jgi:hypothetical protein